MHSKSSSLRDFSLITGIFISRNSPSKIYNYSELFAIIKENSDLNEFHF